MTSDSSNHILISVFVVFSVVNLRGSSAPDYSSRLQV